MNDPCKVRRVFGVPDALFLMGLLLAAVFVFLAAGLPCLFGWNVYALSSDSMRPALCRGDLVAVCPAELSEIQEGDIVLYRSGPGVVAHRVYSIDRSGGVLRTKADASNRLDPAEIPADLLLGKVVYKLPWAGFLRLGGEGGAA